MDVQAEHHINITHIPRHLHLERHSGMHLKTKTIWFSAIWQMHRSAARG